MNGSNMFSTDKAGTHRAADPSAWPIEFAQVNGVALKVLPKLLHRWLPDGRREGREWVARNPRRNDRQPGSFKINLRTGRWADFATGAKGGDVISLCAYLFGLT